MRDELKAGTVLIQQGALSPASLQIESEPYWPGWRSIKNLDSYLLGRKIREAGWTFFYLAGELKATALGVYGQETIYRAVKQILARLRAQKFNCLEINEVASKRFLGVPYLSVTAHSRHIQESGFLSRAEDHQLRGTAKVSGLSDVTVPAGGEKPLQTEVFPQTSTKPTLAF